MDRFDIYSGGRFVKTEEKLLVSSPYSGKALFETCLAGKSDLESSIEAAENVQSRMAKMSSFEKYAILSDVAEGLLLRKQELAETLSLEAAKPLKYSLGEVDRAIQTFRVAAEEAKRLPGEIMSLDWTPAGNNKEGIVKYFPVGIVAGISPFNFPLNLTAHKIAPAIAAGCPIILKPARSTPISVLKLAEVIDKTALPKGALSVLPMDRETGNYLVEDDRFALLTFTGSPKIGWDMKSRSGRKKVVLELGGNAGVLVSDSADIEKALPKILSGAFAYSGQVCIHTQRIFVHERIFDAFVEEMVRQTQELKIGDPFSPDTDVSSMIDEDNARRVENWVNEAVENGAELLCGGKREGCLYSPTLLTGTVSDMKVCALEVFGPVAVIEKYSDFDDAVNRINESDYGLQAGVFTDRLSEMNQAFSAIKCGGIIINDVPTFRVDHMPYGGVKNSGFGREGLKYAMHDMLEPRLLVKDIL